MDIKQQLKKQNIDLDIQNDIFVFKFPDNSIKKVNQADLENYLLLCLINYIKI